MGKYAFSDKNEKHINFETADIYPIFTAIRRSVSLLKYGLR